MTGDPSIDVDAYLGPTGAIAQRLPHWEERPEQLELARGVARALRERRHLLAEAGTGVGKSFAYLLPAVLHACSHHGQGPVVISTRTIGLQQQLQRDDLPFLQAILPLEWSVVTAFGRNHYVCLRRMHMAQRERGVLFGDPEREAQLTNLVDWSMDTTSGQRIDLPEPVDDAVWDEVKAEHGNCLNRACKHYDACHWQRARRRMATAQVLVVNHALYMADVALRVAGTNHLPQHAVVVFDEAHHLPRVATDSLGFRLTYESVLWHLRRLHPKRARRSLLAEHGTPLAITLVEEARRTAERFFSIWAARLEQRGARNLPLGGEAIDDPLSTVLGKLTEELSGIAATLESVDLRMETNARMRGLAALQQSLLRLCAADLPGFVRWVEATRSGGAALRAAPLDVSETLRKHVFGPDRSCTLTSATLGPTGDPSFTWLRGQLGIDDADTMRLGSPFDYRNSVQVVVPDALPDPKRDAPAHQRAVGDHALDAVLDNGGRALVLCTSWASVRDLAERLREPLADDGIQLLVQGEAPLHRLLAAKRDDPTSVLIGTDSLWEGIDVPGDALTLVVVTRLPFAQPDHPLDRARRTAIEERGGDSFLEHSLPEAILKFRQGFGRLIRRGSDRGRVLVLDPRARTRLYGRRFLDALPDGTLDEP